MTERKFVLKSERLGFVTLVREDIPTMTAWFQNLEFGAYLRGAVSRPMTLEAETKWFEEHAVPSQSNLTFGILELETNRLIGTCSLMDINPTNGIATLGIGIGETDCLGNGYGTEAVKLLVEYGMFFLNLHNIKLEVFGFNPRAIRAYEKAGFSLVGRRRAAYVLGGERFDDIIMDITRDDVDLSRMRAMIGLLPDKS
jgi:[ribosomal protein S5]-alanine N-acetyltransferase